MAENKLADLSMDFAVSILKVTDGINWDDGLLLGEGIRRSCWYSNNLTIKMPNGKTRMYLKYSENINDIHEYHGCQVNNMLAYFEKED